MYNAPNSSSYMNSHMYDFQDLRTVNFKPPVYCKGSIMDIISTNPNFKNFYYIMRMSKLDYIYNDPQANFTLFVASDDYLKDYEKYITTIDKNTAVKIIKTSTLRNKIVSELLQDSPISYFVTLNTTAKLRITSTIDETIYVNDSKVIQKDIETSNGIIHVINGLLLPPMMI